MYLIVGLGNPDSKYALTPHNAGFMVCDLLSFSFNFNFDFHSKFIGQIGNFTYNGKKILVLKPFTYMNLSGNSVSSVVNFYKIDTNKMIVVHDDIDLEFGVIRIKKNSSSGGHKGVQSIIDSLGHKNFLRVKIGIGKDSKKDTAQYVLSTLKNEELEIMKNAVGRAKNAVMDIIEKGYEFSMNIHNRKNP